MSEGGRGRKNAQGSSSGGRNLREMTVRQRVLLIGVLLAAPLLLLVVLELGLRLAGYGGDYPLFVNFGPEQSEYLVPNQELGARYFPSSSSAPRPTPDLFLVDKPEGGLRLFVQGASSAAGFPYGYGGAFSRMLEQRLSETYPDRVIEIVNTSLTGTNSYTLLDVADEIIEYAPDAVLIYAGHNEYYGVLGVGSSAFGGRFPGLIRLYLSLRKSRTVQLVASIVGAFGSNEEEGAEGGAARTLMEELAGEQSIPFDSRLHRKGVAQFRSNLRRILDIYHRAGVPVYVATIGSNIRDLQPFKGSPEDATDSAAYAQGVTEVAQAIAAGDTASALETLHGFVREIPTAADPRYALAKVMDRSTRYDSARERYREARDRDRLPFRAPSAMNGVIREEAERGGANVVDVLGRFTAASPHGLLGGTLMLEHVHPNIEGQFLIADAFYERLLGDRLVPDSAAYVPTNRAREEVPVTAMDSLIGEFYIQRLTAGFPFQPRGTVLTAAVDTMTPRNEIEAIALDFFNGRMPWIVAQERLRNHYASTNRLNKAIHVDLAIAQQFPMAAPLVHAAVASRFTGDLEQAERLAREALERGADAQALLLLGGVAATRGDSAEARKWFREAAQIAPLDRQVSMAGRALEAIPDLERRTRQDSGDVDALSNLGAVYFVSGQYDRAEEVADRILRMDPDHDAGLNLKRQLRSLLTPQVGPQPQGPR